MAYKERVLVLLDISSNEKARDGNRKDYDIGENIELVMERVRELLGHTPVAVDRKSGDSFSFDIKCMGFKVYGDPKAEQILTDREYDKPEPKPEPVKIISEKEADKNGLLKNQDNVSVIKEEKK